MQPKTAGFRFLLGVGPSFFCTLSVLFFLAFLAAAVNQQGHLRLAMLHEGTANVHLFLARQMYDPMHSYGGAACLCGAAAGVLTWLRMDYKL